MRKIFSLFIFCFLVFTGCSDGADPNAVTVGLNSNTTNSGDSNLIRAEQFVLAAGETMNLTQDTTILATDTLNINGLINLQPGVNLTLFAANQLTVSGQIGPAAQVLAREEDADSTSLGIRAQGDESPNAVVLVSPDQTVSGSITGAAGQDVLIAVFSPTSGIATRVNITGTIVAGPGAPSTARGTLGEPGGDVVVGGEKANAAALDLLGETPESLVASQLGPVGRITVNGTVRGGRGGKGFTDTVGTLAISEAREFVGGRGGPGGNVLLNADDYDLERGVEGGTGGPGGDCGPGRGQDGVNNEDGENVDSFPGPGGNGGDVLITDTAGLPFPRTVVPGLGGRPGNSFVAAGNGSIGGFDGGNLEVQPNRPGMLGAVSPLNAATGPRVSQSTFRVVIENGGHGGTSTNPLLSGGDGGNVTILPEEVSLQPNLGFENGLDLTIRNYGNGGRGADACNGIDDQTPGKGGNGGQLVVGDSIRGFTAEATPTLLVEDSFKGGNNGNGSPQTTPTQGSGGPELIAPLDGNPTPITIVESFVGGLVGGPCPSIAFEVDIDPNTPGLQTSFVFQFSPEDPECGNLPPVIFRAEGEGESLPLDYTLTPQPPAAGSGGVTIPSTSGSLQPGQSVEMTPTFDCNSDSISQIWNLRVNATNSQGEAIENTYILEYSGAKVTNPVIGFLDTWAQIVSSDDLTAAQGLYVPDFRYNGQSAEEILGFAPGTDVDISNLRVARIGDPDPEFNNAVPVWVDFRRSVNSAGPPTIQFVEEHKSVFRLVPSTGAHPWAVVTQQSLEREVTGTFVDGTGALPAPNPQPPNFATFQFNGPLGPVMQSQTLQPGTQVSGSCELENFLPAGLADFTFLGFSRQLNPLGSNDFGTNTFNVSPAISGYYLAEFYAENGVETVGSSGFAFSYAATARTIEVFIPASF